MKKVYLNMNFSADRGLTLCACFFPKENTHFTPPPRRALLTQGFFFGLNKSLAFNLLP